MEQLKGEGSSGLQAVGPRLPLDMALPLGQEQPDTAL